MNGVTCGLVNGASGLTSMRQEVAYHCRKRTKTISEYLSGADFIADHIESIHFGSARIRLEQRCQNLHQCRFAGAIRSEQSKHARPNVQTDSSERLHSARIGFG